MLHCTRVEGGVNNAHLKRESEGCNRSGAMMQRLLMYHEKLFLFLLFSSPNYLRFGNCRPSLCSWRYQLESVISRLDENLLNLRDNITPCFIYSLNWRCRYVFYDGAELEFCWNEDHFTRDLYCSWITSTGSFYNFLFFSRIHSTITFRVSIICAPAESREFIGMLGNRFDENVSEIEQRITAHKLSGKFWTSFYRKQFRVSSLKITFFC